MHRLTNEQIGVINRAIEGYNVFITGRAGTGKSLLIRELSNQLKDIKTVRVLAPTGVAAVLINGQTYHSFTGIQTGVGDKHALFLQASKNPKVRKQLQEQNLLLIFDEASMIAAEMFDKLDYICRNIRNQLTVPFGGIQIIVFADFRQLPPIGKDNEAVKYAFESNVWPHLFYGPRGRVVQLKQIFRQLDETFVKTLEDLRMGVITDETRERLLNLSKPINVGDDNPDIEPLHLYCKRVDVEQLNTRRIDELEGNPNTFIAEDTGAPIYVQRSDNYFMAPKTLTLKINCQVMLLKNMLDLGLSNGSLGKVVRFEDKNPCVKFTNGLEVVIKQHKWELRTNPNERPVLTRKQIPLMLAYATTIHKAQGITLDRAVIDLDGFFVAAQPYVALSRVRASRYVQIINFDPARLRPNPVLDEFEKNLVLYETQIQSLSLSSSPSTAPGGDNKNKEEEEEEEETSALAGDD